MQTSRLAIKQRGGGRMASRNAEPRIAAIIQSLGQDAPAPRPDLVGAYKKARKSGRPFANYLQSLNGTHNDGDGHTQTPVLLPQPPPLVIILRPCMIRVHPASLSPLQQEILSIEKFAG